MGPKGSYFKLIIVGKQSEFIILKLNPFLQQSAMAEKDCEKKFKPVMDANERYSSWFSFLFFKTDILSFFAQNCRKKKYAEWKKAIKMVLG